MAMTRDGGPDDVIPDGRDETTSERADRNWNEVLQELRVLQTGTQILTGCSPWRSSPRSPTSTPRSERYTSRWSSCRPPALSWRSRPSPCTGWSSAVG
jgi:hypothetical protein